MAEQTYQTGAKPATEALERYLKLGPNQSKERTPCHSSALHGVFVALAGLVDEDAFPVISWEVDDDPHCRSGIESIASSTVAAIGSNSPSYQSPLDI